jgi:hypothetical protein
VKNLNALNSHGSSGFLITTACLLLLLSFGYRSGFGIGVWLGGWLYDQRGSYDIVWWLGVAFGIMAAIVHWPIRERRAT